MKNTRRNMVGIISCAVMLLASTACSRRDDSKTKASQTTTNQEGDKNAADKSGTGLLATGNADAPSFPGGVAITAADLTASPPQLPAAPPKYDPTNPISHQEYARFAWREFIALYYREPRAFFDLLSDPARREDLRDLLQGDVWERDGARGLASLRSALEGAPPAAD